MSRRIDSAGLNASDPRPQREGPSEPKRPRLMNKAMRFDSDSTSSNGFHQYHANGSSPTNLKNGTPSVTNGHSSPTNRTSPSHQNGLSPSRQKTKTTSFYGHDREEVTRLLIQGLDDLGYHSAANRLSQESGYEVESPIVVAFRNALLHGQWLEAESLLFGVDSEADGGGVSISKGHSPRLAGLKFIENADCDGMRFMIRQQKYLELLETGDTGRGVMVLRNELQPLHYDADRLAFLSKYVTLSP